MLITKKLEECKTTFKNFAYKFNNLKKKRQAKKTKKAQLKKKQHCTANMERVYNICVACPISTELPRWLRWMIPVLKCIRFRDAFSHHMLYLNQSFRWLCYFGNPCIYKSDRWFFWNPILGFGLLEQCSSFKRIIRHFVIPFHSLTLPKIAFTINTLFIIYTVCLWHIFSTFIN